MKFKIKKEILEAFKETDFASVFDLTNLNVILNYDLPFFETWVKSGQHGGMKFLEKNFNVRKDPTLILKNAKTALIFLFPYAHGHKVRHKKNSALSFSGFVSSRCLTAGSTEESLDSAVKPRDDKQNIISKKLISKYAHTKDYHKIIKKILTNYALTLQEKLNHKFEYRPVVDSIPFFERAYGRETGLGFIGKNTLLIRPGIGSFFFLGTLLTDVDIDKLGEENVKKNPILSLDCGDCRRCLDACPTQAIKDNYSLDANQCLSYLTIEHRDTIPKKFLKNMDKTIYGCDICQEVCPYNFVTEDISMLMDFKKIHAPFLTLTVESIATMTESQYQTWFGGTALTRARYDGLVRNALCYLFATKSPKLQSIMQNLKNSSYLLIRKTIEELERNLNEPI